MNITQSIKRSLVAFVVLLPLLTAGMGGVASAQIPYDPNGTPTSKTPVFNQFYNVPDGVGNEADFVRVKPQAGTNADYVDTLNVACNDKDAYTVRTYVHNGADPAFNQNGTGSAVARNVKVAMTAPLGSTNTAFPFRSSISASNAATVTDSAHLNCAKSVKLDLVSGSVKTYSKTLGWKSAPDSAVNGVLPIDSHVVGSDDVWACWEERVIVTYDVKVTVTPTPPVSTGECKVTDLVTGANRTVTVKVTGSTNNATIVGYEINFGDGTKSAKQTDTHTYAKDGTYNIVTKVQVKFADGHTEWKTAAACTKQVTFKTGTVTVPPVTPPTPVVTATSLPDTGAGSVAGIFAATSVAGAMAYRVFMARRLGRE